MPLFSCLDALACHTCLVGFIPIHARPTRKDGKRHVGPNLLLCAKIINRKVVEEEVSAFAMDEEMKEEEKSALESIAACAGSALIRLRNGLQQMAAAR